MKHYFSLHIGLFDLHIRMFGFTLVQLQIRLFNAEKDTKVISIAWYKFGWRLDITKYFTMTNNKVSGFCCYNPKKREKLWKQIKQQEI